jgi:hypothetical protein
MERTSFTRPITAPGYTRVAVVPGGPAGPVPAPDVRLTEALVGVIYYPGAGTAVTDVVNLTGQFTIAADGIISNNGGTDTSAGKLLLVVQDRA